MQTYETDLLSKDESSKMERYLNSKIGTEYEINDDPAGSNKVYICILDLTQKEVGKIRGMENSL